MSELLAQAATGHANTQFARAFDTAWLKTNLPRHLCRDQEAPGAIAQVEIINAWESSKRTTVHYQLDFVEANGQRRKQMYVGFLVTAEQLDDEYKSILRKAKQPPAIGPAAALIAEANLILLAYPNDRKMQLLSETQLQPWLAANLHEVANGALADASWQVQATSVEMLRYVPEKRFTARCTAELKTASGAATKIVFIVKQLNDGPKAKKLYRDLQSLCRAWPDEEITPVRFPRALALDEDRGAVFIEALSGDNLKQVLFDLDLSQIMPAVGRLLADFHRAQKRVRKKITVKNELAENREAAGIIVKTLPQYKLRLKKLIEAFKAFEWNDGTAPVLLHGTFRLNHIFLVDDGLALLDLDSLRMGHPAYDIANLLSSLYYLEEAHGRISAAMRREISRYFLAGYAEKMAHPVSPPAVLWFLASLMINKQAKKYVAHSHENCEAKVERMLALAETVLALGREAPRELTLAALWQKLP